jgi:immunity protein 10 of polymorphic toxin system
MRDHGQRGRTPPVIRDVGEHDGDVFVIAIREADAAGSWTLTFMEPYDVDDPQEILLGMDTYCLVVDPGQATCYGGVRECVLDGQRLRLTLTAEAAGSLGMPVGTSFDLELSPQQVDLLGRGLARVLTSGRAEEIPQRLSI